MRLLEALEILKSAPASSVSPLESYLACGFQPLHLATFLGAHLQQRFPKRAASLRTGLYGSLEQSLKSAAETDAETVFVVWEWPDLDPRLSLRSACGWRSSDLIEILKSAESAAARISRGIENLAQRTAVVLACPTTPIVPASHFPVSQTSPFVAKLRAILWSAVAEAAALPSVRVIETQVGGHNPAAELKTVGYQGVPVNAQGFRDGRPEIVPLRRIEFANGDRLEHFLGRRGRRLGAAQHDRLLQAKFRPQSRVRVPLAPKHVRNDQIEERLSRIDIAGGQIDRRWKSKLFQQRSGMNVKVVESIIERYDHRRSVQSSGPHLRQAFRERQNSDARFIEQRQAPAELFSSDIKTWPPFMLVP